MTQDSGSEDIFSPIIIYQKSELMELAYFHGAHGPRELLDEIGRLRILAWEHDGERPVDARKSGDIWLDDHDDHAHHWAVSKEGKIIAAARLCVHKNGDELPDVQCLDGYTHNIEFPAGFLNRLVVHPLGRGKGLARYLDNVRLSLGMKYNCKTVVGCTGNPIRIQQLAKQGFEIYGESPKRFVENLRNL